MIQYVKTLKKNLQDPSKPKKTYAVSQSRATMEISDLAKHMEAHNTPFTRGTISAILTDAVECIRELILDGYIINLGDLGRFNVSLKSNGVSESEIDPETKKKPVFTAADIYAVNLRFKAGSGFQNMISDASFTEVDTSSKTQAALSEKKTQLAAGTYGQKDEEHD